MRRSPLAAHRSCQVILLWLVSFPLFLALGCGSGASPSSSSPIKAPAPQISTVSPSTVPAGSAALTLAVSGSNFVAASQVLWNGSPLSTGFVSPASLTAVVPASLIASGATDVVSVLNPDGASSISTATAADSVAVNNPVPTLTSISPAGLQSGGDSAVLTLTGSNFNASSVGSVNGGARPTQVSSSTSLSVTLSSADLASSPAVLQISVANPAPGGGASTALPVRLVPPTPVISSLSPANATFGAKAVTLTVTGSHFTSDCYIALPGVFARSTFVSSTTLTTLLPDFFFSYVGTINISVNCPMSAGFVSNALPFSVQNPVPIVTSLSSSAVVAGAPSLYLSIEGTNFSQNSTVLVNGTPQTNTFPSNNGTQISLMIGPADLAKPGNVQITVSNPAPGGGTSAPLTIKVLSAANRIRTVNVPANDVASDERRHLLYVASPGPINSNTGSIVVVDPATGATVASQPIPGSPSSLVLTDDQQFLYVAIPSAVLRLNLPDLSQSMSIPLGQDSFGNPNFAISMQSAPGQPHVLALSTKKSLSIYDDSTPRAQAAVDGGSGEYAGLAWGSDASTLYASEGAISGGPQFTFAVSAAGAVLQSTRSSVFGDFVKNLIYDAPTQHLLDGYGNTVFAATGQLLGRFSRQNSLDYEANGIAVDSNLHRVFFFVPSFGNAPATLQAFNEDSYLYINSLEAQVPNTAIFGNLIRWGTSGLALTGTQLILVDGPFVAANATASSAQGGFAQVSPTLVSVTPNTIPAGSGDTQLTVTGTDLVESAVAHWGDIRLPITVISSTQATVTVPSSLLATSSATSLTVDDGPGTPASNPLGVTVLPTQPDPALTISVLPIGGRDLIWNPAAARLYLAVPDTDPQYGNQIVTIDPVSGAATGSLPTASGPDVLALSSDNQFLYAGFGGLAVVQQYTLPSLQPAAQFQLVPDRPGSTVGSQKTCTFAVEIAVAPGRPQTLAVSGGNPGLEPLACGPLAIYDSGVPRPQTVTDNAASVAWSLDGLSLFTQNGPEVSPQDLDKAGVLSSGVSLLQNVYGLNLGARIHFDPVTSLLYSDSGRVSSTTDLSLVATFPASGLMIPDAALGIAFFLGQNSTNLDFSIQAYDLRSRALLRSIALPPLLGRPIQFVRWGASGLAFTTFSNSGIPTATYIVNDPGLTSATAQPHLDAVPVHLTWNPHTGRSLSGDLAR